MSMAEPAQSSYGQERTLRHYVRVYLVAYNKFDPRMEYDMSMWWQQTNILTSNI